MSRDVPTRARRWRPQRLLAISACLGAICAVGYAVLLVIEWADPVARILNVACLAAFTLSAGSWAVLSFAQRRRQRRASPMPAPYQRGRPPSEA